MHRVVGFANSHSKVLLDQVGYTTSGPKCSAKGFASSQGFGTLGEQCCKMLALLWRQQSWSSRPRLGVQALRASECSAFEPLADSAWRDAQGFSDKMLLPSFAVQFPSTLASILVDIRRSMTVWSVHRSSIPHTYPRIFS